MRDLPLNKQQQKDGCFNLSLFLVFFIIGLAILHYAVNDSVSGMIQFTAGFVITLIILKIIDKIMK